MITRVFSIVLFISALFLDSYGQVPDRRDLFARLKTTEKDTGRAVLYNTIARTYVRKQPDSAIFYFDKSVDVAERIDAPLLVANTLSFKSMTFSIWGKQDSARINLQKVVDLCKKEGLDSALHQAYFGLGNVLESQGAYTQALENYLLALAYFEEKNYLKSLNRTRAGMSYIYLKTGEYEKAYDLIKQSNKYYKEIGAERQLMNGYSRMGSLFTGLKKADSSIWYYKKAVDIAEKINAGFSLAQLQLNLAQALKSANQNEQALSYFRSAISSMEKDNAEPGDLIKSYTGFMLMSEIVGQRYNESEIRRKMKDLLSISEEPIDRVGYYEDLWKIDSLRGDFKNAFINYQNFSRLRDSLFNETKSEQLLDIETRYETQKIKAEADLAAERAAKAEAQSQRNLILFVSAIILAIAIIIIALVLNAKQKQKKEAQFIALELRESQKRLAIEKQYRDSELKALKAQMNPHFIFNVLNSIQEFIVMNQKDLASDYLATFAELIRNYLHYSNQGHITIGDEIETLEKYLQLESLRFEEKLRYEINLATKEIKDRKIPTMIIQPYVENAIKHGLFNKTDDQLLKINIVKDSEKTIEVTIEDNGIGREKSKAIQEKRTRLHEPFAMEATQSRLELLNQQFASKIGLETIDLKDADGKAAGTKVILLIPLLTD